VHDTHAPKWVVPVKAQATVALDPEVHERLEAEGDSKSAAIREAVRAYYGFEEEA